MNSLVKQEEHLQIADESPKTRRGRISPFQVPSNTINEIWSIDSTCVEPFNECYRIILFLFFVSSFRFFHWFDCILFAVCFYFSVQWQKRKSFSIRSFGKIAKQWHEDNGEERSCKEKNWISLKVAYDAN